MLGEAGAEERCDKSAGVPCAGDAHGESLMLGRIPATGERKRFGEACAGDAQKKPDRIELPQLRRKLPSENQRAEREQKPNEPDAAATEAIGEQAEDGTEE